MANSRNSEYKERLQQLKGSMGEQAKELAVPVAVDLVSGLTGWWIGRQMGRSSLALGLITYAGGKVHSLHEHIAREEQRLGVEDAENRPALSGFNPLYKNENRVYHGESPLVNLGFGMMLGGAFSQNNAVNGIDVEELSATEKATNAFSEIADDLKYRLYLDKLFKDEKTEKKTETKTEEQKGVSGLSEIDIFIAGDKLTKDLDMSKLDEYDNHLEQSAIDFDAKQSAPQDKSATPKVENVSGVKRKAREDYDDDLGEITRII
jgi:hypothetical protein